MMINLVSPASHADSGDGIYGAFQYGSSTYRESDIPDLRPSAGILRLGLDQGNGQGFEFRLGLGLSAGGSATSGTSLNQVEAVIETLLGGYVVAPLATVGHASFYGSMGITSVGMHTTGTVGRYSSSMSSTETGPSFGIGMNYRAFNNNLLNFEYMSYLNGDRFSLSMISVGLVF